MARLIAIGDIHGELVLLDRLLAKLALTDDDQVVFLGDYIDRGPDSRGVVERIMQQLILRPQDKAMMGNHEMMCLDAHADQSDALDMWVLNGGAEALQSYDYEIPHEHLVWMAHLHICIATTWAGRDFYFSHAGLHPMRPVHEQLGEVMNLLWKRKTKVEGCVWSDHVISVFGHTPQVTPLVRPHMVGLDGGCCFGSPFGRLRAGAWDEDGTLTIYEASNRKPI